MAPVEAAHHHRSNVKANKSFKSKHGTKGALKEAAKGRVAKKSPKAAPGAQITTIGQKAARRNHAKQLQAQKRRTLVNSQKIFTGEWKAPRVVAVLGLCEDLGVEGLEVVIKGLAVGGGCEEGAVEGGDEQMEGGSSRPYSTIRTVHLPPNRFKASSTLQFILLPHGTPLPQVLTAISASDFLITVLSPSHECSPWGETSLRSLQASGTASGVIGLVSTLSTLEKASSTGHGLLLDKVIAADQPGEAANAVRCLMEKAPREVKWREGRGRVVAEESEWVAEEGKETGTLKVTGYVRGGVMSANRLIHLPQVGDFRISQITASPSPRSGKVSGPTTVSAMETDTPLPVNTLLQARNDGEADDLASTNVPSEGDAMLNEQTWPTEEEIASAPANLALAGGMIPSAKAGTTPKTVKRVPKGTSAYQAAWLMDEDDEDDNGEYTDEEVEPMPVDGEPVIEEKEVDVDIEEYEDLDIAASYAPATSRDGVTFADLPEDVEASQLAAFRERSQAERTDMNFPDEIDTPLHIPASQRFARYRGLKSFRTSSWDPYENLPEEYGRLFDIKDWKGMGRRLARKSGEEEGAIEPGRRVTIWIEAVPKNWQQGREGEVVVATHLFRHEHKYSVVHFTALRNTENDSTLKSKDPLVLMVGNRYFTTNPIWSQHTQSGSGKGVNNVHKFERFLRPGQGVCVGTAYLPVTFGTGVPVLCFQQEGGEGEGLKLLGTGSLLGTDTTRIVAKRIVLTGHPYKVHKKTATIRYMFFTRPDIEYFKPIQLKTKKGRTGHIREPLGTHGYFKAGFDGPVDQMDTICMSLYKRCFPRWGKVWAPGMGDVVGEGGKVVVEADGDVQMG